MKNIVLLVVGGIISLLSYSQDSIKNSSETKEKQLSVMIDGELGFNKSDRSYKLYSVKPGVSFFLKEKTYFGVHYKLDLNPGNLRFGNRVVNASHYVVSVGPISKISKKVTIIPSVGLAYSTYAVTGTMYETIGVTGITETKLYNIFTDKQLGVPMNLRLMFGGSKFATSLNFYILASKYTTTGVSLTLSFGSSFNDVASKIKTISGLDK